MHSKNPLNVQTSRDKPRPSIASVGLLASIWLFTLFSVILKAADSDLSSSQNLKRRIEFVRTFSSEKDLRPKRSILNRFVDLLAGPPTFRTLVRPYGITTDSQGRILITDPGALAVHLYDFRSRSYSHLEGNRREPFQSPIGIAVDAEDNIYVTDSRLGKIFVFDSRGKFRRFLGEKRGEGLFKRPTGIAIDAKEQRIYLSDTLYNKIFVLDFDGNILHFFGGRGSEAGHFNYPTAIALWHDELLVMDTMNFRLQVFDHHGNFKSMFGELGDGTGTFNRPKGIALDSEGNVYVVEGLFETVQVFNLRGQLLYYFGSSGIDQGEFQLPAGIWLDSKDTIYIADSYNHRIQVFQLVRNNTSLAGAAHE